MQTEEGRYSIPAEVIMDAFAYHRLVVDDEGVPVDFIFLEINPAFEVMIGRNRDEIIGKPALEVFPELKESGFDWIDIFGRVALTGKSLRFEHSFATLEFWCEVTAYSDRNGFFGTIFRDITERYKTEKALLESEEKYRLFFEYAPLGIYYIDSSGVITECNEKFIEIIGSSRQALIGLETLALPDKKIVKAIKDALQGHMTVYEDEYRSTTAEKVTPVRALFAPLYAGDGKVRGSIGIIEDITERKRAEADMLKLNAALEQQAKERAAVDAFTYSVSHDLQAPLRRISGFSEALLEEYSACLDEQGQDYLSRIVDQAGAMNNLVDALLKISWVSRHGIKLEAVDLSALVRSRLSRLQGRDPGRQVETVVEPNHVVAGDADLLSIALGHLLDNSWKFMDKKESARIEFGVMEKDGQQVFYIRDNGAGFDMHHAEKLFAPFEWLHDTVAYPGTGIGLNIVYRIITRHGGSIWAEGEIGKGATFYFTLF